jgi:erythromycin esterase
MENGALSCAAVNRGADSTRADRQHKNRIINGVLRLRISMTLKNQTITVLFLTVSLVVSAYADDIIIEFVEKNAVPLTSFEDFHPFLETAGTKKLVLLGESSHGTSEYYTWRADISKYLIQTMDFKFIAVEADWPSAYVINRYVKNLPGAAETAKIAMEAFVRWPHWMWKNQETLDLVEWLREHNSRLPMAERVGFYGVDLQNKQKSIQAVLRILEHEDETLYQFALENYNCLTGIASREEYLRNIIDTGENCSKQTERVYRKISNNLERISPHEQFNLSHNARLIMHAEQNLRASLAQGPASWNIRASHFQYTAEALLSDYGKKHNNVSGIIWAHNTHIGDASATTMARSGMVNIGQLARSKYGRENVLTVGFGSYTGEVLAGRQWGADKERMSLPEAPTGTWEYLAKNTGHDLFAISFDNAPSALKTTFIGHRAVGVTYSPEHDLRNYVPTRMADRYDIFMFFRKTSGLTPLGF